MKTFFTCRPGWDFRHSISLTKQVFRCIFRRLNQTHTHTLTKIAMKLTTKKGGKGSHTPDWGKGFPIDETSLSSWLQPRSSRWSQQEWVVGSVQDLNTTVSANWKYVIYVFTYLPLLPELSSLHEDSRCRTIVVMKIKAEKNTDGDQQDVTKVMYQLPTHQRCTEVQGAAAGTLLRCWAWKDHVCSGLDMNLQGCNVEPQCSNHWRRGLHLRSSPCAQPTPLSSACVADSYLLPLSVQG